MFRRFVLVVSLVTGVLSTLCSALNAADVGPERIFLGVWPPTPTLYYNLLQGVGNLTDTRASVAYEDNIAGVWAQFATTTIRQTNKGALLEGSAINRLLHNRDFTNASWTKTNITAALNQTGIDNSANSASSLTATAGNATVSQSVTLASSVRVMSAFFKRITGSGEVDMSTDGGTTWTALTVGNCWQSGSDTPSAISSSYWVRCAIPSQTVTNPVSQIRIVTSGDAVAVDFIQNETTNITSPILTTTVAVTRAADLVTQSIVAPLTFSIAGSFSYSNEAIYITNTGTGGVVSLSGASNTERAQLAFDPSAYTINLGFITGNVSVASWGIGQQKFVMDIATHKMAGSNSGIALDQIARVVAGPTPAVTNFNVGAVSPAALNTPCDCYVRGVAMWGAALNTSQLKGALALLP